VLRNETAIHVSIPIINAFVEMRRLIKYFNDNYFFLKTYVSKKNQNLIIEI